MTVECYVPLPLMSEEPNLTSCKHIKRTLTHNCGQHPTLPCKNEEVKCANKIFGSISSCFRNVCTVMTVDGTANVDEDRFTWRIDVCSLGYVNGKKNEWPNPIIIMKVGLKLPPFPWITYTIILTTLNKYLNCSSHHSTASNNMLKEITTLHWNVLGLHNIVNYVEGFITDLNINAVRLVEHWMQPKEGNLNNFDIFNRSNSYCCWCAIIVNDNHKPITNIYVNCNYLWSHCLTNIRCKHRICWFVLTKQNR